MLGGGFDTLHPWCSTTAVSPRATLALIDGSSNDNDEEDKTAPHALTPVTTTYSLLNYYLRIGAGCESSGGASSRCWAA